MLLEDKIFKDYQEAMKSRDALRSSALSFLRAEFKNYAIDKKKEKLDDKDAIEVIRRQVKRLNEAIELFKKGNRQDLVDKETKGLEILQAYLPKQLSQQEITKIIDAVINSKTAVSLKDMGAIMKEVMAKSGGLADGKLTSEIVKQRLQK